MEPQTQQLDFANHYDDEISISELLMKLWAKRGLIIFLPLILAGLTVAGLLAGKAANGDRLSYYIELTAIDKGAYPNGTQFSPQDLLNPEVTQQLAEEFDLENPKDIPKHVRISFGSPASVGLLAEFNAALSANSKARPEEIESITNNYRTRIENAAQRGLLLDIDYVGLGMSKENGSQFAVAIPEKWNEIYTTRFRVMLDTGIAGFSATADEGEITTAVGAMQADLHLRAISEGVEILKDDGRFRALVTEQGVSPADLKQSIADFRKIYFEPLYAASFGSDDSLSRVYRRDLSLRLREIGAEQEELDRRINSIQELQTGSQMMRESGSTMSSGSQVQLESDALGQLVMLSRKASLAEYLQASFDQRLKLVQEKAELTTRLNKMGDNQGSDIMSSMLVSADFITAAQDRYSAIRQSYTALLNAAQASAQATVPSMYKRMTGIESSSRLVEKRDALFIALALVLGGMIAVIAALVWPSRKDTA